MNRNKKGEKEIWDGEIGCWLKDWWNMNLKRSRYGVSGVTDGGDFVDYGRGKWKEGWKRWVFLQEKRKISISKRGERKNASEHLDFVNTQLMGVILFSKEWRRTNSLVRLISPLLPFGCKPIICPWSICQKKMPKLLAMGWGSSLMWILQELIRQNWEIS